MAKHARPDPAPQRGLLRRVRAAAVLMLAAVALGGAVGLVLTDDGPSAASLHLPPHAADRVASTTAPTVDERESPGSAPVSEELINVRAPRPAAPVQNGWDDVLGRLDAMRTQAFASGDVALLRATYVEGSSPFERDAAALRELAAAGVHTVGLGLMIDKIEVVRAAEDEAVLRVTDRMPGYQLVSADGSVAEVRPARGPATWLVTVRGGETAWRIAVITAA